MAEKMLNDMTAEDIEALFSEESDEKQENENKENWRELFGEDQEEDLPPQPKTLKCGLALPSSPKAPKAAETGHSHASAAGTGHSHAPAAETGHSHATAAKVTLALPSLPKTTASKVPASSHTTPPTFGLALPSRPKSNPALYAQQSCEISTPNTNSKGQGPTVDTSNGQNQRQPSPKVFEAASWTGGKRKRTPEESEPESPSKKQKKSLEWQFRCRYGCPRAIKTKAALKAHSEKVHNLWYSGQSKAHCGGCGKRFKSQKDHNKHENGPHECAFDATKRDWKVPPPRTVQEYADTWGMTILHGEVSQYLRICTNDQTDLNDLDPLPVEHQIEICNDDYFCNYKEMPAMEVPKANPFLRFREDSLLQGQAPPVASQQQITAIDDDQNDDTFLRFMRSLTYIGFDPNWPADIPDWLWVQSGLDLNEKPTINGHTAQNPIIDSCTVSNASINGCVAQNPIVNGHTHQHSIINGHPFTNPIINGQAAPNPIVNGHRAQNPIVNEQRTQDSMMNGYAVQRPIFNSHATRDSLINGHNAQNPIVLDDGPKDLTTKPTHAKDSDLIDSNGPRGVMSGPETLTRSNKRSPMTWRAPRAGAIGSWLGR